jgi:ABC-type glutathione transport system ATPase component
MTPLLSFVDVSKRFPDGGREIVVLDRVCMEVEAGVAVGLYGARRAGKSTLLRTAAGIERPDSGSVRFDGREMTRMSPSERGRLLRGPIAFVSAADWRANPRERVLDMIATSLGSEGLTMREARRRALAVLDEVGVGASLAEEVTSALSLSDRARVMLARALARRPRLLVLDEPAPLANLGERDRFYALVRATARERELALLLASEEIAALQGFAVLMSIADGRLSSSEGQGTVVQLPRRRGAGAESPQL